MADINSNLPTNDTSDGTVGSAVPTIAAQVGGKDNSGNLQPLKIDAQGGAIIAGEGTAGTPTGGVLTIQGSSSATAVPVSQATIPWITSGSIFVVNQSSIANIVSGTVAIIQPITVTGTVTTISQGNNNANFSFGDVTTSLIAIVPVRRTTYTEQTSNAQRSVVSSSASDSSAGIGARTIKITYFDSSGNGPNTETITLNGTTAVNTVNTNICYIEKIEVLTVGTNLTNVGILTLKATTGGGGATIGTINAGDNQTFWTHHYIANGKICHITGVSSGHNGTTVGSGGLFIIKSLTIGTPNSVEKQVTDFIRLYGQSSTFARDYSSPIQISGPARLISYVTPETASSTIYRSAFDFYEL